MRGRIKIIYKTVSGVVIMDNLGESMPSNQSTIMPQLMPKKHGWWKWLLFGGGLVGAAAVGAFVVGMAGRVDYEESYQVAKEAKVQVAAVAYENNCANVVNFADEYSPNMAEVGGLDFKNLTVVGVEFDKLYELIRVKCMENSDSVMVLY